MGPEIGKKNLISNLLPLSPLEVGVVCSLQVGGRDWEEGEIGVRERERERRNEECAYLVV